MIFSNRQSVVFEGCKSCYVIFWEKLASHGIWGIMREVVGVPLLSICMFVRSLFHASMWDLFCMQFLFANVPPWLGSWKPYVEQRSV